MLIKYSKPTCFSSATLLLVVTLNTSAAFADETPAIEEQDCLYYLGEDAATLVAQQEASVAKRLGLKLGLSVRKRQATQWLRGYQLGYAAAKGETVNQTSEATGLSLDSFCAENRDSTLLNAAKELVPSAE